MKERHEQEVQKLRRELDSGQTAGRAALTQADQLRGQLTDLQTRHDEALRHADVTALEMRRQLAAAQSECGRLRQEAAEAEQLRARLSAAEEAGAGLAEKVRRYEADIKYLKQEVIPVGCRILR
jgi:chromosome segregation ATPase